MHLDALNTTFATCSQWHLLVGGIMMPSRLSHLLHGIWGQTTTSQPTRRLWTRLLFVKGRKTDTLVSGLATEHMTCYSLRCCNQKIWTRVSTSNCKKRTNRLGKNHLPILGRAEQLFPPGAIDAGGQAFKASPRRDRSKRSKWQLRFQEACPWAPEIIWSIQVKRKVLRRREDFYMRQPGYKELNVIINV